MKTEKPGIIAVRNFLNKFYMLFSGLSGFDPRRTLRSLRGIPRYARGRRKFRGGYDGKMTFMPCLSDWYEEGGNTRGEYFLQDLLVARWIFEAGPQRHVDVGSRIDGFVAHLASFREVEVFDLRNVSAKMPGIIFKQADFMGQLADMDEYCDSLSCLHALEHFGLGRYGDPINPDGYKLGLANMARILKRGGRFYLSVPIGQERVAFNAHRVFDPRTVIRRCEENGLKLESLSVIGAKGAVRHMVPDELALTDLARCSYNLGLFIFKKGLNMPHGN